MTLQRRVLATFKFRRVETKKGCRILFIKDGVLLTVVYKKFLRNFTILQDYFNTNKVALRWPSGLTKKIVEEFYSILKIVWDTLRSAQSDSELCLNVLAKLQVLYMKLKPKKTLPIFDTTAKEELLEERLYDDLDQVTQQVLIVLERGLEKRYFDRYHPLKAFKGGNKKECRFSYVFEACHLLVPKWRNGKMLGSFIKYFVERDALDKKYIEKHLDFITEKAFKLLADSLRNAEHRLDPNLYSSGYLRNDTQSPIKSRKPESAFDELENIFKSQQKGRRSTRRKYSPDSQKHSVTMMDCFRAQIKEYLKPNKEFDSVSLDENLLIFWKNQMNHPKFPLLSRIAFLFLGAKSSSAALERDFSPASDLLTRKRANIKPWLAEVLLGIKLHEELVPDDLARIPQTDSSKKENFKKWTEEEQFLAGFMEDLDEIIDSEPEITKVNMPDIGFPDVFETDVISCDDFLEDGPEDEDNISVPMSVFSDLHLDKDVISTPPMLRQRSQTRSTNDFTADSALKVKIKRPRAQASNRSIAQETPKQSRMEKEDSVVRRSARIKNRAIPKL